MNYKQFGSLNCLRLKYRKGEQIIHTFRGISFPQQIRSPFFNYRKFWKTEKMTAQSCRMLWSLRNEEEFGSFKCLKLKYQRRNAIIQPFCRIGSPKEIRSPFFHLRKFWKTERSTAESCRMHWNLMNDKESSFFKCFTLKYRRGGANNSAVLQSWVRLRN